MIAHAIGLLTQAGQVIVSRLALTKGANGVYSRSQEARIQSSWRSLIKREAKWAGKGEGGFFFADDGVLSPHLAYP